MGWILLIIVVVLVIALVVYAGDIPWPFKYPS